MLPPGTADAVRATRQIHRTGHCATHATAWPRTGETVSAAIALMPSTVATGAAGTASTFAGTATSGSEPEKVTSSGSQNNSAAAVTAAGAAAQSGTPRSSSRRHQPGATISNPAV